MSKWSRLKVALLTAATTLSALQFGGCLGGLGDNFYERVLSYVVIGNIWD